MYWIDTNAPGNGKQVSFWADAESDILNLPTMTDEGVQQGDDTSSNKKVDKGSTCMVIETGDVYTLTSLNNWDILGG